jgi:hypothetical protein
MNVAFSEPCVIEMGSVWFAAMVTGIDPAALFVPSVGTRASHASSERRVDNVASVAAPVGSGSEAFDTGMVDWFDAMTTGLDVAIVPWPWVGVFVFIAKSVASVAAPPGSGNATADIGCVAGRFVTVTLVCGLETVTVPETGCVAGKFETATVPETGCVAGRLETVTLVVGFDTVTVPATGKVD